MTDVPPGEVTVLLERMRSGDSQAQERLFPLIYEELHGLARRHMRRERSDHTLQTTALLHEAFLKLVGQPESNWQDRKHFLAVASCAMRHVLVDHARSRKTQKAGGSLERLPLDEALEYYEEQGLDFLAVHEALESLSSVDPELTGIVEMHFFAGLTFAEISTMLTVSERTIYSKWCLARAWLRGRIAESERE